MMKTINFVPKCFIITLKAINSIMFAIPNTQLSGKAVSGT
jgi:hypothetical protein